MDQAKPEQSQDSYAQRSKSLTSQVQRLRGWVGTDPSKTAELADALVELTAHRLLGHGYAAAAEDAQEAVRRARELLAAKGPIGPYTSVSDAARYVTAVVHLAAVQTGIGMSKAAARILESLQDIQDQLGEGLRRQLQPQTAIWALLCSARAALASGEVATANAYADAALSRLSESRLGDDPDRQYLAMDVERLVSECRWAAGRPDQSVMFLHAAKNRYDEAVGGRLRQPGRLSPALLERLTEPLFDVYRAMADRLIAIGEVDLGLVTRRTLIELLRGLTGRLGDLPRVQLATALSDLARDLATQGRGDEAEEAADEAVALGQALESVPSAIQGPVTVENRPTRPVSWTPLPPSAWYGATTGGTVSLTSLLADRQRKMAAWLQAERDQAHRLELEEMKRARVEAERREIERAEAERAAAAQLAAERAHAEKAERLEAERRAAAEEGERLERKRRREERIEAHRLEVERREAERREVERLEAERLELKRLQHEIDELER
jgi:hypothetical protein